MKMKKIIAWISAMAMVAMMFVGTANAANWNPILTYTDVNANQDVTDDTLKIVIPANITWTWETVIISIKNSAWNAVDLYDANTWATLSDGVNVTSSWIVADEFWRINVITTSWSVATDITVNFSTENNTPDWIYTVNIVWTMWVWAATFYVNKANEVKVSASVEPILIMNMSNSPIWFWQLIVDQLKTATWEVVISTNAAQWVSLLVQSSNTWTMIDSSNGNKIKAASGVTVDMSTWSDEDNYWYWIRVKSTQSWTDIWWYISNALVSDTLFTNWTWTWFWPMSFSSKTIAAQTAWWSNWAVVEIEYWVRISALQPAWNYTDTVTYTVTWNF